MGGTFKAVSIIGDSRCYIMKDSFISVSVITDSGFPEYDITGVSITGDSGFAKNEVIGDSFIEENPELLNITL